MFVTALARKHVRDLSTSQLSIQPPLKTAYVVHPRTKMENSEHQGLNLTGSRKTTLLPTGFLQFSESVDVSSWRRLVEKVVVFENQFQDNSAEDYNPHKPYHVSFTQSLLKALFSRSSSHQMLKNLHVSGDHHISCSWLCMGKQIDVRGRPGVLVQSRNLLRRFYESGVNDSNSIQANEMEEFDIRDPFSKLSVWNVRGEEEENGFQHLQVGSFPYFHTLIRFCESEKLKYPSVFQSTLLYLHGLARMQAFNRNSGNPALFGELSQPECVQGLVTDGRKFSLIFYQLNSLLDDINVSSSPHLMNTVAITEPEALFDGIEQTTKRMDFTSRKLTNYNESLLRSLVSLFVWQNSEQNIASISV